MANTNLPQDWAEVASTAGGQENPTPAPYADLPQVVRDSIQDAIYRLGLLESLVGAVAENYANGSEGDFLAKQMYGSLWHIRHAIGDVGENLDAIRVSMNTKGS